MSLQYIIDGYNMIKHPSFANRHKRKYNEQAALVDYIRTYRLTGSVKNKVVVVFDGYPPSGWQKDTYNNVKIIFARDKSADAVIREIVEGAAKPANVMVISDDREVKFYASSSGASYKGIEDFVNSAKHYVSVGESRAVSQTDSSGSPDINFSQASRINSELRRLWLKEK